MARHREHATTVPDAPSAAGTDARNAYAVRVTFPFEMVCDVTAVDAAQAHDILIDHFRRGLKEPSLRTREV